MNSNNLSSIREAFSQTLIKLASDNLDLYVVSADLKSSLTLDKFASKFRQRFIECGVAENNAAGVAAGLAKAGKTVFLATYACFSPAINWNVIKQSICYNKLNVKIIGSHGGLMTGELGSSHQMLEDISLMRSLPGMEVFAPIDAFETTKIITTISRSRSPAYVRLVRPATPTIIDKNVAFTIGKSAIIKIGKDLTIAGYGPVLIQALNAQAKLNLKLKSKSPSLEIINCSSIKPLDGDTIITSVKKTGRLIVIEDHQKNGGLGEAIASLILGSGIKCRFVHLAVNDQFGRSATDYTVLWNHYSIGTDSLITTIKKLL